MIGSGSFSELASGFQPVDYPRDLCIHELLERQAAESPHSIAVEFEGQAITYRELHARANRLARVLRDKGVAPGVLTGICVERSLEMVIAVLGVLKAGGAYVPLDHSHGKGRIEYILDEAKVAVLLTQKKLLDSLPPVSAEVLCLEAGWGADENDHSAPLINTATPGDLAYVIYTSGSTGKPKGVQLEHRSVVNFLCSMRSEPGLSAADVLVAVTTLSFDIAGLELLLPLITGAKVVVANRETTYDGAMLAHLLARSGATVLQATPATWRLLFECGWPGDRNLKVLVGGEAVSPQLARRLASCCGEVWNMYGPTETTIWSSVYRIQGDETQTVPIGRPIANTALYILDGDTAVAAGAEGELCIGGDGLARGYFLKPELTAAKFVRDPFAAAAGARMYRTGDLARLLPDGNVAFLGRLDHQVKIRGFRIELGEIEAVLEQHPAVRQAVVVARQDASGEDFLAAFLVPAQQEPPQAGALRAHLRKQVPEYMVPAAFTAMPELPLTHNGKIDRKALPHVSPAASESSGDYVAPRNDVERRLAALWQEALRVPRVSVHDNFFDLGGRSLLAARLFVRIAKEFGKELPISVLFAAPTIELLARELEPGSTAAGYTTLVPIRPRGAKPAFFCVHGGGGSTLFLQHLAERVNAAGHPFYGIEPDCLDGSRTRHETVEQMAAYYLSEIRRLQPSGPYHLGGYCFGGLVAYEMAQQLRRAGERVDSLVLFSGPLRFNRPPSPAAEQEGSGMARLKASPRGFASLQKARVLRSIRRRRTKVVRSFASMLYRAFFAAGMKVPASLRPEYVRRTLIRAELDYTAKAYAGPVTLIYGSKVTEFGRDLGWGSLVRNLEHRVIGDTSYKTRREQFEEPLVERTAAELLQVLNGASRS